MHRPDRALTENERRVLEHLPQSELPPVPKDHLEILEPLTRRELLDCIREANTDRQDHISKHHPHEQISYLTMQNRVLEKLVEDPEFAAAVAESTSLAGDPPDENATEGDALEVWRWGASNAVSQDWTHVTEGHLPPAESEEGYLRRLVERVLRQSLD